MRQNDPGQTMGHSDETSIQRTKYLAIWQKTCLEYLRDKALNNLAPTWLHKSYV